MPINTEKRLRDIIDAFNRVGNALDRLETALAAVDVDEYKPAGHDFIRDMAWGHKRMREIHICYSPRASGVEEILKPKSAPITDEELKSMADEDGNLIGAE